MCLEELQNTSTREQALSPGDEGTRRWRKMDVLHQIGADWWLQEMQLRGGIKHNNPAEAAAQNFHCSVQFIAQVGGTYGCWKHQQERKKHFKGWDHFNSISRRGLFQLRSLEKAVFKALPSLGTDITEALTSSTVTSRHISPEPTWRHCRWPHITSQREPTCPVREI